MLQFATLDVKDSWCLIRFVFYEPAPKKLNQEHIWAPPRRALGCHASKGLARTITAWLSSWKLIEIMLKENNDSYIHFPTQGGMAIARLASTVTTMRRGQKAIVEKTAWAQQFSHLR